MEGMGYNLDPNMLVSALTKDDDSFMGGNNGLLWIFLLILLGGNGFGGFGNKGGDVAAMDAAITKAQAAGCSDELILTAIAGNKEAVANLASMTSSNFHQVDTAVRAIQNGICELGYKNQQDTASIISQITAGDAALSRQVADCCCATQRGIDQVRYDMQTGFNAVNTNLDKCCCETKAFVEAKIDAAQAENRAGFQGIRDYLVNEKIEALQSDLQTAQFTLSQNNQTKTIEDYVKSLLTVACPKA